MLIVAVGARAYDAQAVQGWHANGGGEVAIAAAAAAALGESDAQSRADTLRNGVQSGRTRRAFHWGAVETAAYFQAGLLVVGLAAQDGLGEAFGLGMARHPDVDIGGSLGSDDVGAGAAADDADVDSRATLDVGQGV